MFVSWAEFEQNPNSFSKQNSAMRLELFQIYGELAERQTQYNRIVR